MPRVAPRRGRAVAVDGLGRRRRGERRAGVVEVAQVASWPLGLERLSRKVGPEIGQADKLEEPADDLLFGASRDTGASLDDLREAVTTLEEQERTARRVYGGAHPIAESLELSLRRARAALAARETPSASK